MNTTKRQIIELAKKIMEPWLFDWHFDKLLYELSELDMDGSLQCDYNWEKLIEKYSRIKKFGRYYHLQLEVIDKPINGRAVYRVNDYLWEDNYIGEKTEIFLKPSGNNSIELSVEEYQSSYNLNFLRLLIAGDEGITLQFYGMIIRLKMSC